MLQSYYFGEDIDQAVKNNLENYVQIIANIDGLKSWKCLMCGKTSHRKQNIQKHMITHTGYKPFTCQYCDYKTAQKCHLKRHIITRHSVQLYNKDLWKINSL